MSMDELRKFKKKLHVRWGDNAEISTMLRLAGLWNRAIDEGWNCSVNIDKEVEEYGVIKSIKGSKICNEILENWIHDGLIRRVDEKTYMLQKGGFSQPKYFGI